jgi:hypothetical protein
MIKYQLETHKSLESILLFFCAFFLPSSLSYWRLKSKIKESNQSNPEEIIRIWQYLFLGFYVTFIMFFMLAFNGIIERSIKNTGIIFLFWMIIYGNFQAKIFSFTEEPIYFFIPSTNIQKRTHRFVGKFLFFGGIFEIILLLMLPKNLGEYFLLGFVLLYFFLPFVYRLTLQSKEPA